ncbi:hypothetical protein HDE69_005225 [Pedobacter cryoconitis]|uniref:Uncharacterized protein n=1 Tax=Pedobacter cryoconitis TaxID=188932 RepID=A0A7W9DMC7_9SPHI|nr:hypothetical protein [Pedobacter cryoconitis]
MFGEYILRKKGSFTNEVNLLEGKRALYDGFGRNSIRLR